MDIQTQDFRQFLKSFAKPAMVAEATAYPTAGVRTSSAIPVSSYGRAVAPTILPLEGRITQGFGVPQAVKAAGERTHAGVDISVPVGTPLPEAVGGVVLETTPNARGYGQTIVVRGNDGRTRRYSHLSQIGVKKGQRVNKGDIIGLTGNSGASTGPHLDIREYIGE